MKQKFQLPEKKNQGDFLGEIPEAFLNEAPGLFPI